MSGIKAIQTSYRGYLFRSRLEARWAIFFDALGLKWEYEPEGFDLGDAGWYLPDFKVYTPQGAPCWYEIKPSRTTKDAKFDGFKLALCGEPDGEVADSGYQLCNSRAALLSGDPMEMLAEKTSPVCPRCGLIGSGHVYECSGTWDYGFGCDECDFETPSQGDEESGLCGLIVTPWKGWVMTTQDSHVSLRARLIQSATAARSARFEHGETPQFGTNLVLGHRFDSRFA